MPISQEDGTVFKGEALLTEEARSQVLSAEDKRNQHSKSENSRKGGSHTDKSQASHCLSALWVENHWHWGHHISAFVWRGISFSLWTAKGNLKLGQMPTLNTQGESTQNASFSSPGNGWAKTDTEVPNASWLPGPLYSTSRCRGLRKQGGGW